MNSLPESSVGVATDSTVRIRFLVGTRNISLLHNVHTGPGVHPVCYPVGTVGSFLGDKAAGV
jgi:hypothetical protein